MNFLQLLPLLIIAVNGSPYEHLLSRDGHNGTIVEFNKHPYLAQVLLNCSGSWSAAKLGVIIGAEYVLMADSERPGNCNYSVWINQDEDNKNASEYKIEAMHKNFIGSDFKGYDVFWCALNLFLFKLSEPIKLGTVAQPIGIFDEVTAGDNGFLLNLVNGFGPRDNFKIYEGKSTALDVLDCRRVEEMYIHYKRNPAPDGTICTIEPMSNYPTPGSTLLVIKGQLVGWKFGVGFMRHNDGAFQLSSYALVSKYKDWIRGYTGV